MMHLMPYTLEDHVKTIEMTRFLERYLDMDTCRRACEACPRHGRVWTCPPFDFDPVEFLRQHSALEVIATKATIGREALGAVPVAEYDAYKNETYALIKLVVEDKLLAREKSQQDATALFPGSCMRCPAGCKRVQGEPCISPHTLRYSLEAFGGLLGPMIEDLFDLKFCWSAADELPEYFLLVSGILHR